MRLADWYGGQKGVVDGELVWGDDAVDLLKAWLTDASMFASAGGGYLTLEISCSIARSRI